ncbi:Transposon Ty3-G Gag-Pol polyprotein [Dictyocoela roeselum]|nr:Transposon Ty3-G Gag-Pol polyprotein [Dictyocoela roeselum]
MQFLKENDAIINLKDNFINLDSKEYEISEDKTNLDEYERTIASKSTAFALNKTEEKFMNMIKRMKNTNPKIGTIDQFEHEINLKEDFKPKFKEYSVPLKFKGEMETHLKELQTAKIIKESEADIVSPAFMIRKKNGKIRLVVDYRELNKHTKPIEVTFPKIFDILYLLKDSKVFTTIDLNQGYYQIPVRKQDIKKTGFRICGRAYVFNRMPFGLSNAPRTFTKVMNKILAGYDFIKIYMDDILIHSETEELHHDHVYEVLKQLQALGASINFEKSVFMKKEVKFLGHIISEHRIRADISNLKDFEISLPKTKKRLQRMLGYLNWFRPFVKGYAEIVSEFYKKLTQKSDKIIWSEEDRDKLLMLKEMIKSNLILGHPDLNAEFILEVDPRRSVREQPYTRRIKSSPCTAHPSKKMS